MSLGGLNGIEVSRVWTMMMMSFLNEKDESE